MEWCWFLVKKIIVVLINTYEYKSEKMMNIHSAIISLLRGYMHNVFENNYWNSLVLLVFMEQFKECLLQLFKI